MSEIQNGDTGSNMLTKREYFAILALQGLGAMQGHSSGWVANLAIKRADALLEELEKTQKEELS